VSPITGTGATCTEFSGGSAQTLSAVNYVVRNGRVSRVSPSGFLYWVRLSANAGTNTAVVPETITTGNFSTLFGLANGSRVYTSACASVSGASFTASPGNSSFTAQWNASSDGTYYIGLRLGTSSVKNQTAPSPPTVHYAFSTNGVTGSTSGIDLTP
jgi:hypothetical protein